MGAGGISFGRLDLEAAFCTAALGGGGTSAASRRVTRKTTAAPATNPAARKANASHCLGRGLFGSGLGFGEMLISRHAVHVERAQEVHRALDLVVGVLRVGLFFGRGPAVLGVLFLFVR